MEKIRIYVDAQNVLVEEDGSGKITTPLQLNEVAWFKFDDGTRMIFVRQKEHWTAEIEKTTIISEYGIQRTKNSCSDVFFTNYAIVEKEIFTKQNESTY